MSLQDHSEYPDAPAGAGGISSEFGRHGGGWRRLLTVPAGTRWVLTLAFYLLGLVAWLEVAAPAHPLPFLLFGVAAAALVCGPAPAAAAAVGGALAIWLFLLGPAAGAAPAPGAAYVVVVFLAAAAVLLALGAALRTALAD